MEIDVSGDQLILSGPVVVGDFDAVESRLTAQAQIKMVVLRNSPDGHAPTGYHLGELFRQRSLETAVSGYNSGGIGHTGTPSIARGSPSPPLLNEQWLICGGPAQLAHHRLGIGFVIRPTTGIWRNIS